MEKMYPWDGEFTVCKNSSNVAVVLLDTDYTPPLDVAVFGPLKTENIGVEKIVANVISNPNIRFLVICGREIRGHRPGGTLIALNKNGVDENNKIIDAPGAIPYIENLTKNAIERFRSQIETINLVDVIDKPKINSVIRRCLAESTSPYGEPYIAIRISPTAALKIEDKRALHSKIRINYLGLVEKRKG